MTTFYLKLYIATLFAFLAIDMLWLGVLARTIYRDYLGFLLAPRTNWIAASVFYLLFVLGILLFVLLPELKGGSLRTALVRGAMFGLITYATYDLTNLATIRDWPLTITVVDMAWGTVLSTAVGGIGYLVGNWLS